MVGILCFLVSNLFKFCRRSSVFDDVYVVIGDIIVWFWCGCVGFIFKDWIWDVEVFVDIILFLDVVVSVEGIWVEGCKVVYVGGFEGFGNLGFVNGVGKWGWYGWWICWKVCGWFVSIEVDCFLESWDIL